MSPGARCGALGVALALLWACPAEAQDRTLKLGYSVYLGGLNIFYLDVNLRLDGDRYEIFGGGETKGMIRMMWRWAVRGAATGVVNGSGVESLSYDVATVRKQKRKKLRLAFTGDGAYSITRTPKDSPRKRKSRKLPKSIPQGTLDPISVSMAVASAAAKGETCGGRFPVFDGNRRYDLTFTKLGEEQLSRPGYSIFSGKAIRCRFEMKRISGFRQNRVALRFWDEAKIEPPLVWLGRLGEGLPMVPIQFQADFNMGYMIIYLSKAEYGDRQLLVPASR
jgi:hypothetical protein